MATIEDVRAIRDTFGRSNYGVVDIIYECPEIKIDASMEHLGFKWKLNDMNGEQICGAIYVPDEGVDLVIRTELRQVERGLVPLILRKEPVDDDKHYEAKLEILNLYDKLHAFVNQEQKISGRIL